MKKAITVILIVLMIGMLASCAAQDNTLTKVVNEAGEIAGFWRGIWHGIIAPFAFIISLFSDKIGIYELHNNGNWYNFGFIIGLSIILGGGSKSTCRRRRRRKD